MLTIDGTTGEGGGQVLRSALGLSLVTGRPFTINNIRGKRPKPGLLRQHLTAVQAACQIGQATATGAELKAEQLSFSPGSIKPGQYHFTIGSAGSCTLVLQAILPALLKAGGDSEITVEGGTHNPFAPSFDYLHHTLFPLLEKMGVQIRAELERPGFYPAGGGKMNISISPPEHLTPIKLGYCSPITFTAQAICAELPSQIGQRELQTIREKLPLGEHDSHMVQYQKYGPGNVVTIFAKSEQVTESFVGFGQRGLRAEQLASRVAGLARRYQETGVAVGPYLADQLLIPMALAGKGQFLTCKPTTHTLTNIEVIKKFIETDISLSQRTDMIWQIQLCAKKPV